MGILPKRRGKSKEAEPPIQWRPSTDGRLVVTTTSAERELAKHVEILQREINRLTTEFTSSTESHESEKRELRNSHQTTIDGKDIEIRNLRHNHEYEKKRAEQNEQEMRKWRNSYEGKEQEASALKRHYEARAREQDQAIEDMEKQHETELIAMEQRAHANETTIRNRYEADIERREVGFTKERADRRAEIDQLRQKSEANEARLIQEHKTALLQSEESRRANETLLKADHNRKIQSYLNELRETNAALLNRDYSPEMGSILAEIDLKREPDEHIKAQFLEVVQMVDTLGRLAWKPNQKVWNDEMLRRVGKNQNQRVLKKSILQDLIWKTLLKHIFASPFRVFGSEGETLEKEWSEQCDDATIDTGAQTDDGIYTWPKPGVKTERWRYFTVSMCREALVKPIPSEFDPRARLRRGFKTNREAMVRAMKSALQEMVEFGPADGQMVERLIQRMSNMWLEFQMHRCRIVISLKETKPEPAAKKVPVLQGALELVVVPSVGRYGNVKGVELDKFTVIGGCAGDMIRLSTT